MASRGMGLGALLILILGMWGATEAAPPRPKPPMPKPPSPPPSPPVPDTSRCFRVEFLGQQYQWTRAEIETGIRGTMFDEPQTWAQLDALGMGGSFEVKGATVTRVECDVLDIQPGPPSSVPLWPLAGRSPRPPPPSGRFKASRGAKWHAGNDLGAPRGTPVLAPEDGRLVASQGWDGPNAKALLMETARPGGPVLLLGAVEPGSWPTDHRGRLRKIEVKRGQQVATVGMYPKGDTMLHFETYVRGTRQNRKWYKTQPKPAALLDPTAYVESMVAT